MIACEKRTVYVKSRTFEHSSPILRRLSHWRRRIVLSIASTRVIAIGTGLLLSASVALSQSGMAPYPAVIEGSSLAGGQTRIEVLGERFAQLPAVARSQSRIVLYRLADSRPGATSIFVNDRYHDSLVAGAWSQLCYSSGPVELATRQMHAATRPAKDRYDAISVITLQDGQAHFLRLDMNEAQPLLRPVSAGQALQEIAATREQLHTVSRVAETCREVELPVAAPVAQTYTLGADTLFAFDRSDRTGMTDAGTRAIELLLSRMAQDYSRIDRVHLIGHADPLGLPERNERLAIERAQTVRDYIGRTGLLQAPMTAEGRSSREPVVRHCGGSATPQAIACNLPNRRVVVEVTGVRR